MERQRCGCINTVDETYGIVRCVSKCSAHVAWLRNHPSSGEVYYRHLAVLDDQGAVKSDHYIAELVDAIGPFPVADPALPLAVEVGCGVSPYAAWLQSLGYTYTGIELDSWAAAKTQQLYQATVYNQCFTTFSYQPGSYGLILMAHCLEHMAEAPEAADKAYDMLGKGGYLAIIVPDDSDLTNPDHWWFFTPVTLPKLLIHTGFTVRCCSVRKRVAHENFIYCLAVKE